VKLQAIEPHPYPWFPYKGFTFCLGLQRDGVAWTSGQSGAQFDAEVGRMVIRGSMADQLQLSYTKLLAVLAEAGFGPEDVVHLTENVTSAGVDSYDDVIAARRSIFGSHQPTVTTVVVDRLVRGKALVELELHAVPGGGSALATPREGIAPTPVREGHDGTIHFPSLIPVDAEGRVVHPFDPEEQYRYCVERALELIRACGLTPEHVVACHEYITEAAVQSAGKFAAMRMDSFGPETVGGTVVMDRLLLDGVTLSLDFTLSRLPKTVIDPGWARYADEPYVPAIRVGRSVYFSAISALDRNTGSLIGEGELGTQAEELYRQIVDLLAYCELGPEDLRSTIEFCAKDEIANYKVVAGHRKNLLAPPWPTSTGDLCTGFLTAGALIQTAAIADIP
jgi:enamine deaminase RidA (YjgF/YER057c/UK114 family)